jgi:hypothetical protein
MASTSTLPKNIKLFNIYSLSHGNFSLDVTYSYFWPPPGYKWSTYRCKTKESNDPIVDFDTPHLSLRNNKRNPQTNYGQYVCDIIPTAEIKLT